MKVLIVEDEKLAIERMQRLLAEIAPPVEVVGSMKTIKDTVTFLQQSATPDLILMDIELSDGTCFDIFKQVAVTSFVVFTTSYHEYALEAFRANSIDYLLKPIRQVDLQNSINKYYEMKQQFVAAYQTETLQRAQHQIQEALPVTSYRSHFLIKQGQRYKTVAVEDIAYFFVDGRLTYLMTWNKTKMVIDHTLEEVEKMVDPGRHHRANRAFVVHKKAVQGFKNTLNGKLQVELYPLTQKEVMISKEKATEFKNWMRE